MIEAIKADTSRVLYNANTVMYTLSLRRPVPVRGGGRKE